MFTKSFCSLKGKWINITLSFVKIKHYMYLVNHVFGKYISGKILSLVLFSLIFCSVVESQFHVRSFRLNNITGFFVSSEILTEIQKLPCCAFSTKRIFYNRWGTIHSRVDSTKNFGFLQVREEALEMFKSQCQWRCVSFGVLLQLCCSFFLNSFYLLLLPLPSTF